MEKYIYKITNRINGLVYIGQSKDPNKRWKQHCIESSNEKRRKNSRLHEAIHKYGVFNFSLEIIEGPIINYNEREQYWIAYYHSQDRDKGYNITIGGEEPPVLIGEKSFLSKYSDELISNVQDALINTNLSFEEISKKYNIDINYLSSINRGTSRKNNNLIYPLRKNGNERLKQNIVEDILYYLLYTFENIESIAKLMKIDSNVIYDINKGCHFYCNKELDYPIRQPYCRISTYLLDCIYNDLLDNKLKMSDIEKKYNLSKATISRINSGKRYARDNFSYPLRPSSKRVYN